MRLMNDRDRGPVDEVEAGSSRFRHRACNHGTVHRHADLRDALYDCRLLDDDGGWRFVERRFDASGKSTATPGLRFQRR